MNTRNDDNTAKVIQLEDFDRSLGTDELNLAEFPLSVLATRSEPGQNTLLFEDTIFDERAGRQINRSLVVAGSDHFGLPTSTDSDILLLLVHLSNVRTGFKSKRVEFSRYELIKFLGWPLDGRSYKRLDESLQRWTSVTLHYKHSWWQRSGQKWRSRSFHVLETLELRGREETQDDGLSNFTWNDVIFESFNSGNLRRIDLGVYFDLKLASTRQMYRFLDKRFYRSAKLVFDLKVFATEHIGLSRNYDLYEIKRKLGAALRELEGIGFLTKMSEDERFKKLAAGKWEIVLIKGPGKIVVDKAVNDGLPKELTARGVNDRMSKDLVARYPVEHIEEKLRLHDRLLAAKDTRISRNPAGYLVAAIRHDFQDTGATSPKVVKKATEPREVTSPKAKVDTEAIVLAEYFGKLPIDEQARIEREATKSLGNFHRETLKRLEGKSEKLLREFRMELIIKYLRSMQPDSKGEI